METERVDMESKQLEEYTQAVDDKAPDNGAIAVFPSSHPGDNGAVDTRTQTVYTAHGADEGTNTLAPTTFQQTDTSVSDRHDAQHEKASRFQKAIYLLFGVLDGLLILRFVLPLLGANPAAGFAKFVQGITSPFIAPFAGLFGPSALNTLVAILAYAVIAWVLAQVVWLVMGDMRRGVRTQSSVTDRHI
jgi:hypothetical protein